MGFKLFFLEMSAPWILLAACFFGAGTARATRSSKKVADEESARNWKIVALCIYFSLGIFAGLLSLIVPGPGKFLDPSNAWLFLAGTAFFFVAFRFRKAVLLPSAVIASGFFIVMLLFIQSITAFTGETEIAKVNVLSVAGSRMELDLTPSNASQPELLSMEGEYFAPVVRVVIFSDFLVFFGAKTWYRFVGMSSYAAGATGIAVQKDIVAFPHPNGISEALYGFFERNESIIPCIKTVQTDVIQKRAKGFASYSIRVENDGGVEVVETG
jgi:hypothetical protein